MCNAQKTERMALAQQEGGACRAARHLLFEAVLQVSTDMRQLVRKKVRMSCDTTSHRLLHQSLGKHFQADAYARMS